MGNFSLVKSNQLYFLGLVLFEFIKQLEELSELRKHICQILLTFYRNLVETFNILSNSEQDQLDFEFQLLRVIDFVRMLVILESEFTELLILRDDYFLNNIEYFDKLVGRHFIETIERLYLAIIFEFGII